MAHISETSTDRLFLPEELKVINCSTEELKQNDFLSKGFLQLYGACFKTHSTDTSIPVDAIDLCFDDVVDEIVGYFDKDICNWSFIHHKEYGIVSMASSIELSSSVFLFNLATLSEARGYGLASILICDVAHKALSKGFTVSGTVARENKMLLEMYQRMGAEEVQAGICGPNSRIAMRLFGYRLYEPNGKTNIFLKSASDSSTGVPIDSRDSQQKGQKCTASIKRFLQRKTKQRFLMNHLYVEKKDESVLRILCYINSLKATKVVITPIFILIYICFCFLSYLFLF